MKKQYIRDFAPGGQVDDILLIKQKNLSQKKNGENYLSFIFGDKSGEIKGVAWDQVEQIGAAGNSGDFVRVRAAVSEYRGSLQLSVKEMFFCEKESIDPADFLPVTARNTESMFRRLQATAEECIRDPHIRKLFQFFWDDDDFVRMFKTAPAAKKMHHAYLGGLLEHTLSMSILAKEIAKHYSGIRLDILLAGAILHDIGKTREFAYEYSIDYSDEGKLLTHIVIGCGMLDEKIRQMEGFPEETALLLKHMIVSHHGSREFGSPEPPKIIEAVLLNLIDDIDAKMNGLREFIAGESPDEAWTSYNYMLGRQLYKGIQNQDPGGSTPQSQPEARATGKGTRNPEPETRHPKTHSAL
ncbi:MAG: HD domain-containing protein [Desulfococcaceae bacterium]|jgi:3'-5' exoribonuclease|nr:HD domain-containing protein [Desulfococcaceae bacterium]